MSFLIIIFSFSYIYALSLLLDCQVLEARDPLVHFFLSLQHSIHPPTYHGVAFSPTVLTARNAEENSAQSLALMNLWCYMICTYIYVVVYIIQQSASVLKEAQEW